MDARLLTLARDAVRHLKPIAPYTRVEVVQAVVRGNELIILLEDGRKLAFEQPEVQPVMVPPAPAAVMKPRRKRKE